MRLLTVVKKINALKARQQLGELLEGVYYRGDQYIIERAGKPMAAVVPLWQLEEWQQRRAQFFAKVEALWDKTKDVAPEVIEQEVDEAVRTIRKAPARRKS
jgi:prevent-host-death family protein